MTRHLHAVPQYQLQPQQPQHGCSCQHPQQQGYPAYYQQAPLPAPVGKPYGKYLGIGLAATGIAVPFLATVTALLLAVGITALALAISGLVIRWLIKDMSR